MRIVNSDILGLLKNNQIICYGAGRAFQNLFRHFPELHIENHIKYIVDRAVSKQGTTVQIGNRNIPIVSLEEGIVCNKEEYRWLIVVEDWLEIYNQLNDISLLDETEVYIYSFVISESCQYRWNRIPKFVIEKFYPTEQIPKKIHYCWFGRNPIPDRDKRMIESWSNLCPDYEIVEWNENNYDIGKLKYMEEAYEAKMWAFVSDAARLDILYHEGGIYLDTDVEIIRNLDPLLFQRGFFGTNMGGDVNTGLGFGAVKGLQLLKDLYQGYEDASFNEDSEKKIIKTCSKYQTEILTKRYGFEPNGEYHRIQDISIYPEEVCSCICLYTGRRKVSNNTYLLHHAHASWKRDVYKMEQRFRFWEQHFEGEGE